MAANLIALITEASKRTHPVSAHELWRLMECTMKFADWITIRLWKYSFVEKIDYVVAKPARSGRRGRPIKDYSLTTKAARHIALLEKHGMGPLVRSYFETLQTPSRSEEDGPDLFGTDWSSLLCDNGGMKYQQDGQPESSCRPGRFVREPYNKSGTAQ